MKRRRPRRKPRGKNEKINYVLNWIFFVFLSRKNFFNNNLRLRKILVFLLFSSLFFVFFVRFHKQSMYIVSTLSKLIWIESLLIHFHHFNDFKNYRTVFYPLFVYYLFTVCSLFVYCLFTVFFLFVHLSQIQCIESFDVQRCVVQCSSVDMVAQVCTLSFCTLALVSIVRHKIIH